MRKITHNHEKKKSWLSIQFYLSMLQNLSFIFFAVIFCKSSSKNQDRKVKDGVNIFETLFMQIATHLFFINCPGESVLLHRGCPFSLILSKEVVNEIYHKKKYSCVWLKQLTLEQKFYCNVILTRLLHLTFVDLQKIHFWWSVCLGWVVGSGRGNPV